MKLKIKFSTGDTKGTEAAHMTLEEFQELFLQGVFGVEVQVSMELRYEDNKRPLRACERAEKILYTVTANYASDAIFMTGLKHLKKE